MYRCVQKLPLRSLFLALQALLTDLQSAALSSLAMALKLLIACFLVPLLAIR